MSAPKTNLETQKRQHIVPLVGMALVAIFGVGLIVYWQFEEASQGASPGADAPDTRPIDATNPPETPAPTTPAP
ncbi:hypothetical protein [Tabrizicola sp.]|uniref:hypothetical protein n=1 Tax=Tabrizicola sp. TaxID=2005166 RepID=UPI002FDCA4F3